MKKLINLFALVILVSLDALTPFAYAKNDILGINLAGFGDFAGEKGNLLNSDAKSENDMWLSETGKFDFWGGFMQNKEGQNDIDEVQSKGETSKDLLEGDELGDEQLGGISREIKREAGPIGTMEYDREGGYFELTYNGQKIRIRDRNVGATHVAANDYTLLLNLAYEYYYSQLRYNPCGIVPTKATASMDEYYEAEFLERAQELLGLSEPLTCEDVNDIVEPYMQETYDMYEDSDYLASFGNYYYRGNNTGAKREDLNVDIDNEEANINPEVIENGFSGGKLGEKNTGWEKGDMDNPCDADNGEYLPTPDDWKNLMQIRGGIKGYELRERYSSIDSYFFDDEEAESIFTQDIWIPNAGIIQNQTIFHSGLALWTAKNGNKAGGLEDGHLGIFIVSTSKIKDHLNTVAMPVRCFVYIDPVTVNFYSGADVIKTVKVEKGKTVDAPEVLARDGYIYRWYTAGGEEWALSNTLSSDTDLYLKWQECGEGYEVVKNQCVIEENKGIKYKNGLIKISDGSDTIYLKDRNQGDIDDEVVKDFRFMIAYLLVQSYFNDFEEQCDDEECIYEKIVEYFYDKTGILFDSIESIEIYIMTLEEKYVDMDNLFFKANGNYYFRGNNTGVSYDELRIEHNEIMNKDELLSKGFDGGKLGNEEGSGWIEGSYNNPCDWNKGEYLPTPQDWKRLLGIWGNLNGLSVDENLIIENVSSDNVFIDGIIGNTNLYSFFSDIIYLVDGAGYNISYNGNEMEIGMVDGGWRWNGQDTNGEIGYELVMPYNHDVLLSILHFNPENFTEEVIDMGNSIAMPVRCFVKVPVVKFETNGGSSMNDMEVFKGEKIVLKKQSSKANATFEGWYKDASLTDKWDIDNDVVEDDMTLYAKWIENKPSGGSSGGGGGGGSSSSQSNTGSVEGQTGSQINSNTGDIASSGMNKHEPESQTGSQVDSSEELQNDSNTKKVQDSSIDKLVSEGYSDEFQQAYQFAKKNGITTMPTIQKAKMNSPLTRIAMAKMLSQYAINILGKKPDVSKGAINFDDVTNKMDRDYDNGVTLAYQLGIMGQNMPNNKFRPNDEVTRAEFVTALSRLLYSTTDGEFKSTSKYYTHHMEKLQSEGIVTNTNPSMKEKRGYVMIMLMRSVK